MKFEKEEEIKEIEKDGFIKRKEKKLNFIKKGFLYYDDFMKEIV